MGSAGNQDQSLLEIGPWGGEEGSEWIYTATSGIAEIIINHGWRVDSLTFKGVDENNNATYSQKFGGEGGDTTKISIEWPQEYLISISGTYSKYEGQTVVSSLNFYTNRTEFGPFGRVADGTFEVPLEEGVIDRVIVGFFGRADQYINAIGVYQKVLSKPIVIIQPNEGITMSMDLPREIGPWGGNKGKAWDDGIFSGIDQIDVHVGNGVVHAIECQYRTKDGELVLTNRQGGEGATTISRITLENTSGEYLVGIMGYYGPIDGSCCLEVVRSISFYTNKGKYGPFGTEIGTFFSSPVSNAKVIGFHGRSSDYLDAIGVHVEYS